MGGTLLRRELGLKDGRGTVEPELLRASFYSASLTSRTLVEVDSKCTVKQFVYDAAGGSVWAGLAFRSSGAHPREFAETRGCTHDSPIRPPRRSATQQSLGGCEGRVTSLSLSPRRALLSTSSHVDTGGSAVEVWQCADPALPDHADLVDLPATRFDLPGPNDIWCSTSSPEGGDFAIGGTNGLSIVSYVDGQFYMSAIPLPSRPEIMAAEYQSRTTIMAGQRNGVVQLIDTRSGGQVPRLSM